MDSGVGGRVSASSRRSYVIRNTEFEGSCINGPNGIIINGQTYPGKDVLVDTGRLYIDGKYIKDVGKPFRGLARPRSRSPAVRRE